MAPLCSACVCSTDVNLFYNSAGSERKRLVNLQKEVNCYPTLPRGRRKMPAYRSQLDPPPLPPGLAIRWSACEMHRAAAAGGRRDTARLQEEARGHLNLPMQQKLLGWPLSSPLTLIVSKHASHMSERLPGLNIDTHTHVTFACAPPPPSPQPSAPCSRQQTVTMKKIHGTIM